MGSLGSAGHTVIAATILAWSPVVESQVLTTVAKSEDLGMAVQYLESSPTGRCGVDWLVIEFGRWKCVRREPHGHLSVVSSDFVTPDGRSVSVLRGAVVYDPRILLTASALTGVNTVYAFDPNGDTQPMGQLPEAAVPPMVEADVDGDGRAEQINRSGRVLSMPGGNAPPFQWIGELGLVPLVAAQLDADAQQEIGWLDSNRRLRFRDPLSQVDDPFQPVDFYFSPTAPQSWDWDGDGRGEIAVGDCCPAALRLLDSNGPGFLAATPWSGSATALGLLAWGGGARRSLAFATDAGLGVVDVENGQTTTFGVHQALNYPQPVLTTDWDEDGDQDLLWLNRTNPGTLWLLRNPEGPEVLQYGAAIKRPLGFLMEGTQRRLLAVEEFFGPEGSPLVLRTRDPDTLETVYETGIGRGSVARDAFAMGDLHLFPGIEVLRMSESTMSMFALTGAFLWSVNVPDPLSSFRYLAVPDFTCEGAGCRQILLTEVPAISGRTSTLRLLDGLSGQAIWTLDGIASGSRTVALTDLNRDGWPEILYTEPVDALRVRLVARDGQNHSVLWQSELADWSVTVRRTEDEARRLAVLGYLGTLAYLDPLTGAVLRQRQIRNGCAACKMEYLAQGKAQGLWILGSADGANWMAIRRDLRGEEWRDSVSDTAYHYTALAPDRIYAGYPGTLTAYRPATDALYADEFEDW